MASGFDARVAVSTAEVTYGTRVAPTRFMPLTAEDLGFTLDRYFSPAIGTGAWGRPSIVTTKVGSGSISGDVPTVGFGFLLNYLNGNTNTPVQDAATTSYATTFNLDTLGSKSFTVQVQNPPVTSATLVPHDMLGCMAGGITFSWSAGGVLSFSMPIVYQNLDTAQTLVTYVAPAAYDLLSFTGGSITIGGSPELNIIGDGSIEIGFPLRDDAFTLGSGGLIAKPILNDKPTASGSFTADFVDNVNLNRTLNNTSADIVMKFEGAIIASTFKYTLQVTLPDCVFTTGRATVGGPGPLQQTVNFQAASSTADVPSILYRSTGATL
jgi:hypothetical protein